MKTLRKYNTTLKLKFTATFLGTLKHFWVHIFEQDQFFKSIDKVVAASLAGYFSRLT